MFLNKNINKPSFNNFFNSINTDTLLKWNNVNRNVEYINYDNELFRNVFKEKNKQLK